MKKQVERWAFLFFLIISTLFGVFVLPFLVPPAYLAGVSAANVAAFNNKVAALAAAVLGIIVILRLCWSRERLGPQPEGDYRKLSRRLVAVTIAACTSIDIVLCAFVSTARVRFLDASYFIDQISDHVDYGRKLYEQIEFPYGPIIFYGPVAMHWLLSPWHASLKAAYFVTLIAEHFIGLLLVVYVLNRLPIQRTWKIIFFLFCAPHAIPFAYGLNYTFFRALGPVASLVAATRFTSEWRIAGCLFVGQIIALGISPEMGFAFAAGSVAYGGYVLLTAGQTSLPIVASPFLAAALFFLIAGSGYLRMLGLFARGIFNFIVEPLPHILLFLVALVWLVPVAISRAWLARDTNTPLLLALYVFSLALLPVALGRADPAHVFFNGVLVYMLSFAAIDLYSRRRQRVWMTCVACILLWTAFMDIRPYESGPLWVIGQELSRDKDNAHLQPMIKISEKVVPGISHFLAVHRTLDQASIDLVKLNKLIGSDSLVVPKEVELPVEEELKKSGHFAPTFYCFQVAILDASAEAREIQEFNTFRWALIYTKADSRYTETPATTAASLGFNLPYRLRRTPYVVGVVFNKNLAEKWQPYAEMGDYEIYKHR